MDVPAGIIPRVPGFDRHELGRTFLIVSLVPVVLAVLMAWTLRSGSDLSCEAPHGDSNYGTATPSWWPVGTTFAWRRHPNGFDRVERPGWADTFMLIGFCGCAPVLVVAGIVLLRHGDRADTE